MIKLGFLGGGMNSIAGPVHLAAATMDRKFEVVGGIFSRSEAKSKETAEAWGVRHFQDLEEMVRAVDLVCILTPTPDHHRHIASLLEFNVGLICDKPLVASIEECDSLASSLKDRFLVVTYNYSGYPLVRELKELISSGELGRVIKLAVRMPQESFFKPMRPGYPQRWRLEDGVIPTVALDLGVHVLHLAHFLVPATPKRIFGTFRRNSNYGVYDDCEMLVDYGDMLGVYSFGKVSLGNANSLRIDVYGEKAGAVWEHDSPERLEITYTDGTKAVINRANAKTEAGKARYNRMAPGHPAGFIEAFANLYVDIAESYAAYRRSKLFESSFVFGLNHSRFLLECLDLAMKSSVEGVWKRYS